MVRTACSLARLLQPAVIVLEDVDLVAEERGIYPGMSNPLLFDVLNEMDGMAEDADVVFLLTTNRVDLLEPALAARPGRVDMAVEIPLPDADARRRLIDLYGRGLDLRMTGIGEIVSRMEGVTASFVKELLRKAALIAAEQGAGDGAITVTDANVTEALNELLAERSQLTRVLLGGHGRRRDRGGSSEPGGVGPPPRSARAFARLRGIEGPVDRFLRDPFFDAGLPDEGPLVSGRQWRLPQAPRPQMPRADHVDLGPQQQDLGPQIDPRQQPDNEAEEPVDLGGALQRVTHVQGADRLQHRPQGGGH
jgi:ATPase family associated with various cellular activities (AAA)